MKKLLLSTALLSMLFTACKKSDDNNGGLDSGQFKVGSTVYSDVFLTSVGGVSLGAVSPTGGTLALNFDNFTLPATSGTFKIVTDADAADEVEIIAQSTAGGATKTYTAGYVSGQTATISVNGGKYSVKFDNVSARNQDDSTETTTVSANLTQN